MICLFVSICAVQPVISKAQQAELIRTIKAIAWVESKGDPLAVGDQGAAIGILQIQPIMVRECNRIVGRDIYTDRDRRSVERSVEMCLIHSLHHWPDGGPEQWSRGWNGGPDWADEPGRTAEYWRRIQRAMKRLR